MANRRYSFKKGIFFDTDLNFSQRSSYVREILLEKAYPEKLIIPMKQHYGVASIPCVSVGEHVLIGQCVGMPASGTFAVPIHSGISGNVISIDRITLPDGVICDAVVIESDKKRTLHPSIRPRANLNISKSEAVGIIRNAGIVGMGGEGVPTAAKINRAVHMKVNRLLVNCLQSEPYATSDLYRIDEFPDSIVLGAVVSAGASGASTISFCISERRKTERYSLEGAIERAKEKYPNYTYEVLLFKERFPQGNYRMIAKALYDMDFEDNDTLEERCKAVMFNCSTLCAVWEAISENMPLVNRIVTVTDDEGRGHNVLAPIGTPVTDLLGNMENVTIAQRLVVWGNCLTGVAFRDTINTPIIKTTGAITVIRKLEVPETPCIHCGSCLDACPRDLFPSIIARLISTGNIVKANEENAKSCIACGACSFVCPAGIDLTGLIASYVFATKEKDKKSNNSLVETVFNTNFSGLSAVSLLEEYQDETKEKKEAKQEDDGRLIIPFEGGLKV
ncbi:MAG: RnfABCDGE type electron transport complex subunit C [Saccharofermentanaceae bacterium]|jgi:electron transport complex protein RnfC|nr:RnfABCDGE type electron transport complex subunit C [Clostridia bacterium]NLX69149.1 RnfABCDGE type electron transport complex subunit C [Clostridiaceae bacterium]